MTKTDPDLNIPPTAPSLTCDWERYLPLIAESDLSPEEQRELIGLLWSIATAFVDLGYDLHPVQQSCGQEPDLMALISNISLPVLGSDDEQKGGRDAD